MANVLAFLAGFLGVIATVTLAARIKLLPVPFAAGFVPWITARFPGGEHTHPALCAGLACPLLVGVAREYRGRKTP